MIQFTDVSMSHGDKELFSRASFTIGTGERCGLVGRNGSGKTTILRLIIGQESPDSGKIAVPKGYRLGYLDQHIRFSKPTVLEEACLGLQPSDRENTYKAERILFGLGFTEDDLQTPPEKLSGGYHLRLHLTKALLSEPHCLLLDEPTNYLDILSLRFLKHFLQRWTGELIIVSHDREFMDSISTHTLGIHRNSIRKVQGSTEDFFAPILIEEETHEKARVNLEAKRAKMQTFINRLGAKASKASQAQSRKKLLDKMPAIEALSAIDELDFSFKSAPFHSKKMGEASHISFGYHDPLIKDLSLSIGNGDRIAIIGKNGYGKSTLLKIFAKELPPQQGSLEYSPHISIGYFGQTNIERLDKSATVETEISHSNPELSTTEVRRICGLMMFRGTAAEKKINILSGGEKSRVLLGKILAKPCNLLLLDEPTHHLDIESVEALIDAIDEFAGAVIIVTHSELILERLSLDTLILCHKDRQERFTGGYPEFIEKIGWQEEKALPQPKAKTTNRADDKRRRAELVSNRAKVLRPIKEQMEKLEKSIMKLEEEQALDNKTLEAGSPTQELLMTMGKRAKEIERQFEELCHQNDLMDQAKAEFEE